MESPHWVLHEPFIHKLLHQFIDRLDETPFTERSQKISIRISKRTCPQLFQFDQSDRIELLLSMLEDLDRVYHVITIEKKKTKKYQASYENGRIIFNEKAEDLVRAWLSRFRFDPAQLLWKSAIERNAHYFEEQGQAFPESPLTMAGVTSEQIIEGFVRLSKTLAEPRTLRELSAQCFWGNSKFLDNKRDLLQGVFGQRTHTIVERPLLIHCYLPKNFSQILFVENQDSFITLADQFPEDYALVYCAGFRGTAERIRERDLVRFSYLNNTCENTRFLSWWFNETPETIPAFFWGDLDASGMMILATLKKAFVDLMAWQPGYDALLNRLDDDHGHTAKAAGKQNQKLPDATGCDYADSILLPKLREMEKYVDQEAYTPSLRS